MTEFINTKPSAKGQKTLGSGRKPGTKNKRKEPYIIEPEDVALLDGVRFIAGRQTYQFKSGRKP